MSPALVYGLAGWHSPDWLHFSVFSAVAMVSSGLKVSLPSIRGTMSVNFFFILVAILQFNLGETLAAGCASIVFQYLWRNKSRPSLVQAGFNLAAAAVSVTAAFAVFHGEWAARYSVHFPLLLAATACVYFVCNTAPIAVVIALTENKRAAQVWRDCYFWSFPYYLLGAALAGCFYWLNRQVGWQSMILTLPVLYVVYRSY